MAIDPYRVVIANLNGPEIDEVPATSLSFGWVLNDAGPCSFNMDLTNSKALRSLLEPGQREIHIYRDSPGLVWGGYLWTAEPDMGSDWQLRFSGLQYFSKLSARFLEDDLFEIDVDQFTIVRDMINYTQGLTNGNMGIVVGTGTSGVTRRIKYRGLDNRQIHDEIQALAALDNGFDFDIDASKNLNMYYPHRGTQKTDISLEGGKNIMEVSYSIDASPGTLMNHVTAVGTGTGKNKDFAVSQDASVSQVNYGLMQGVSSTSGLKRRATVSGAAAKQLQLQKQPVISPTITFPFRGVLGDPPLGSFYPGDQLYVKFHHGYIGLDSFFRVNAFTVSVDDVGQETGVVTLGTTVF